MSCSEFLPGSFSFWKEFLAAWAHPEPAGMDTALRPQPLPDTWGDAGGIWRAVRCCFSVLISILACF